MPLNQAALKALAIALIGDADPTTGEPPVAGVVGAIAANFDTIWEQNAPADAVYPGLRWLRTQRDCIKVVQAPLAIQVTESGPGGEGSVSYSDRFRARQKQLEAVEAQIKTVEEAASSGATRSPALGVLQTQAPISPPWPGGIDANDPRLTGSPYYPSRRYPPW